MYSRYSLESRATCKRGILWIDFMEFHWITSFHLNQTKLLFKKPFIMTTEFVTGCFHSCVYMEFIVLVLYFYFLFLCFVLYRDMFQFQTLVNCYILSFRNQHFGTCRILKEHGIQRHVHVCTWPLQIPAHVQPQSSHHVKFSLHQVWSVWEKKRFITESGPFTKVFKMWICQIIRYRIQRNCLQYYTTQVYRSDQPPNPFLIDYSSWLPYWCVCCSKYFTEIELEKTIKKARMPFQLLRLPRQKSPNLSELQNRTAGHRKYFQGFSLPVEDEANAMWDDDNKV